MAGYLRGDAEVELRWVNQSVLTSLSSTIRVIMRCIVALGVLLVLQACGGGASSNAGNCLFGDDCTGAAAGVTSQPALQLAVASANADPLAISSASPATVTATVTQGSTKLSGRVVSFNVVRGLAVTNVATALTDANGQAFAVLSPASSAVAGADEVTATVEVAGASVQASQGFKINATDISLVFGDSPTGVQAGTFTLSAYGQASLQLQVNGASVASPVNITLTSSCVTLGKASLSPASLTMTGSLQPILYRDLGCGALQTSDEIQAAVIGSSSTAGLSMPLARPEVSSVAFVSAVPEAIYLRGSGLADTSAVTFQIRDGSGNPLSNEVVSLALVSGAGGVQLEGRTIDQGPISATSDANGEVTVRINSGTVPTPVRVQASVASAATTVSTVSSNLSVAVGLPSQRNFSLSQTTRNIEGFNLDGTTNTYNLIASDRNGNPVPAGTSVNFVTEGGQVEQIRQVQLSNGIASAAAGYVSAAPRPADGRVTITAYALGEESFIDLNGNNIHDAGEPFQDLGDVFKDNDFNGLLDLAEESLPLGTGVSAACVVDSNATFASLLALGADSPSLPNTCDGAWSQRTYVRKAVETVLSTSAARPLWLNVSGLDASCTVQAQATTLAISPSSSLTYLPVGGQQWFGGGDRGTIVLIASDANSVRLNPMAAGTTIEATTSTTGLTVAVVGGSPVPSTTEATAVAMTYEFTDTADNGGQGLITVKFTSPSGLITSVPIPVSNQVRPSVCAL